MDSIWNWLVNRETFDSYSISRTKNPIFAEPRHLDQNIYLHNGLGGPCSTLFPLVKTLYLHRANKKEKKEKLSLPYWRTKSKKILSLLPLCCKGVQKMNFPHPHLLTSSPNWLRVQEGGPKRLMEFGKSTLHQWIGTARIAPGDWFCHSFPEGQQLTGWWGQWTDAVLALRH